MEAKELHQVWRQPWDGFGVKLAQPFGSFLQRVESFVDGVGQAVHLLSRALLPEPSVIEPRPAPMDYDIVLLLLGHGNSSLPDQSSSAFIPSITLNTIGQMNASLMRAVL
jgi:hypothetical protein